MQGAISKASGIQVKKKRASLMDRPLEEIGKNLKEMENNNTSVMISVLEININSYLVRDFFENRSFDFFLD